MFNVKLSGVVVMVILLAMVTVSSTNAYNHKHEDDCGPNSSCTCHSEWPHRTDGAVYTVRAHASTTCPVAYQLYIGSQLYQQFWGELGWHTVPTNPWESLGFGTRLRNTADYNCQGDPEAYYRQISYHEIINGNPENNPGGTSATSEEVFRYVLPYGV